MIPTIDGEIPSGISPLPFAFGTLLLSPFTRIDGTDHFGYSSAHVPG